MRRSIAICIIAVFLIQGFAGIRWTYEDKEIEYSITDVKTGQKAPGNEGKTRAFSTESDAYGGSWFDQFSDETGIGAKVNITVNNWKVSSTDGILTSITIDLPQNASWDTFSLSKTEPLGTYINVSFLDAEDDSTIPGYENLTTGTIDISNVTANSVKLRAFFSGSGQDTPILESWGVDWIAGRAWRDSFISAASSTFDDPAKGDYDGGSARLGYSNNQIVPGQNTTLLLHLDEGTGNVTADSSGNDNNGTIDGANWTEGMFGQGLEFDGQNDHVNCGNDSSLNITKEITIEAWIKPYSLNAEKQSIIEKTSNAGDMDFALYLKTNNRLTFESSSFGTYYQTNVVDLELEENKWYHVAATYDRVHLRTYVNGIMGVDIDDRHTAMNAHSYDTWIGANANNGQHFHGIIDEVSVYNRSLDASEIENHSLRYHTGVNLLSEPISLAQYYSWDRLMINKTESENHDITVSVLDNATDQAIPGLGDLNGSDIDISSLDAALYPVIRLNATFAGNGSATPLLDSWGVSWENQPPVLDDPIGFNPLYRTESFNISMAAFDNQEDLKDLEFTAQYRFESPLNWTDANASEIHRNATHLFYNSTTLANANIGFYDFRFRLNDSLGESTGWVSYFDILHLMNNIPTLENVSSSSEEVFRGSSIYLNITNVTDVETSFRNLGVNVMHRLSGEQEWNDSYIAASGDRGSIELMAFSPDTDAALGYYDIKVEVNDTTDVVEYIYPKLILVRNNAPTLGNMMAIPADVPRTEDCTLTLLNARDMETSTNALAVHFEIRNNGTEGWQTLSAVRTGVFNNNIFFDIVFDTTAALGGRDIRVRIDDGSDNSSYQFDNILAVENNLPSISDDLGRLWLREDTPKTFSLSGFGSDTEDGETELNWSVESSSVNLDLIDNIDIASSTVVITPIAGVNGSNDVDFTLTDKDGGSVSKSVTIDVISKDIELAAVLTSPGHMTTPADRNVTLKWDSIALDPSAPMKYEIYMGEKISWVLAQDSDYLIGNTTGNSFTVKDLAKGVRYYWSVIPINGTSTGICIPAYYWFEIERDNRLPTVELISPSNGTVIDTTSFTLDWAGSDPDDDVLVYHVYVSDLKDDVKALSAAALEATTAFHFHTIGSLKENTTYYWTVIPDDNISAGNCSQGIWSFNVSIDPIATPEAILTAHDREIIAGEEVTFNILYTETGDDVSFRLDFHDGASSEWGAAGKIKHVFESSGPYPIALTAKVNGIEIPVPGGPVITVVDPDELGLLFYQPIDTGEGAITISGKITGIDQPSENLTIMVFVNGKSTRMETESYWSGEIPRMNFEAGTNVVTVKLLYKGNVIASTEKEIEIAEEEKKDTDSSSKVLIVIVILLLIIVMAFFLVSRRRREEEAKQERIESSCPECGDPLAEGAIVCENCGFELEGVEEEEGERPREEEDMDQESVEIICSACGAVVDEDADSCPECGEMLEEEGDFLCTKCGESVSAGEVLCPNCGESFYKDELACDSCGAKIEPDDEVCPGCGEIFE